MLKVSLDLVDRHFTNANPRRRRGDKILTVAKLRDQRNLQAGQKPREHLQAQRILPGAIGDNRKSPVATVNLRNQQQFGNELRRGMNINLGGQHRDQNAVGVVGLLVQLVGRDSRRQIHDEFARLVSDFRIQPAVFQCILFTGRHPVNDGSITATFFQPAHAVTLRVAIHQCWRWPTSRIETGEVGGQGRFAGATFGIQDHNLLQIVSIRCIYHRFAGMPSRTSLLDRYDQPLLTTFRRLSRPKRKIAIPRHVTA